MFQYAAGKSVSLKSNQQLKLDITSFNDYKRRTLDMGILNINSEIATDTEINHLKHDGAPLLKRISYKLRKKGTPFGKKYFREPHFQYTENILNIKSDAYLFGYWQSPKYFDAYRTILLHEFTPKSKLSAKCYEYENLIKACNSVSIHIRRGDYISNSEANSYHGTCPIPYYKEAVNLILSKVEDAHFFIFSDDLPWVKENFSFITDKTFIEEANSVHDFEEMYLMSKCSHNIIANSSFSWWGAWLNQNPDKTVIAPQKWFTDPSIDTTDLIPENWIRL